MGGRTAGQFGEGHIYLTWTVGWASSRGGRIYLTIGGRIYLTGQFGGGPIRIGLNM